MIATVHPSYINGTVRAPRSKSDMQRATAAALLHNGRTVIKDPGRSNDDLAALEVIQKLGATVLDKVEYINIESRGVNPSNNEINCGESGLGVRMFTPIAALSSNELLVAGSGSLLKRPMNFFDDIFPLLGIKIQSNEGKLPMKIHGPLQPSNIEVDGSLSSQFLTGLLMAYAASDASGVTITVNDLKSKPYIDMTLRVIKSFGMKLPLVKNYREFIFENSHHDYSENDITYAVEGDWSGAAFLFVAGAIANEIRVEGMREDSVQADKKILEAIKDAGAKIIYADGVYKITPSILNAFEFDATECPDLFPPLVALAAYCRGITKIKGANRLTHKESNRALTLQDVFGKMGIEIELKDDWMFVHGGSPLQPASVHSHHDHRIAMAAAVAALKATGPIVIEEAEAINKSYPAFYNDIISLGATIRIES
ncbi:MAG: 3-phosphoshikimate 1-carboxyvinyltransferase [Chitinophagia bacterium]|nr:3-phosphoshikimate 1-carboxyvinyltransferase [Chitinophagia bacterium]